MSQGVRILTPFPCRDPRARGHRVRPPSRRPPRALRRSPGGVRWLPGTATGSCRWPSADFCHGKAVFGICCRHQELCRQRGQDHSKSVNIDLSLSDRAAAAAEWSDHIPRPLSQAVFDSADVVVVQHDLAPRVACHAQASVAGQDRAAGTASSTGRRRSGSPRGSCRSF